MYLHYLSVYILNYFCNNLYGFSRYFVYNNELFYCGRIKDMINLNGENIYPQDIEWSIQQNPNVRKGSVSTFDLK